MAERESSGFRELLGVKIIYRGKDKTEAEMLVREEICRPGAILHGGAFMGFADIVGGNASFAHMPEGAGTVTIESKTNFFAAVPLGDTVKGVARALHAGRTTVVVQTEIFRGDGKLAAVVTQTQLVLEKRPAKG